MKSLFAACLFFASAACADTPPMAVDNDGTMTFSHAPRAGERSKAQRAALEASMLAECAKPTNPITQGMIETRGPAKCMAFVRNQCSCTDCDMPSYCLPGQASSGNP